MMNEYIKSIMNRDHKAKYMLIIFLTDPGVIIINQSFVLNCFFLKKECIIYQNDYIVKDSELVWIYKQNLLLTLPV